MKKKTRTILVAGIIIVILISIGAVYILNQEAIWKNFDLSQGNSGSNLGGFTTPIISIFTSILLFLTLKEQSKTNQIQSQKNNTDFILSEINEIQNAIDNFYFTYSKTENNTKENFQKKGVEALNDYAKSLSSPGMIISFQKYFQADQILFVIKRFNRVEENILSQENLLSKTELLQTLDDIYKYRLKFPIETIINAGRKFEQIKDQYFEELLTFAKSKGYKIEESNNDDFDLFPDVAN